MPKKPQTPPPDAAGADDAYTQQTGKSYRVANPRGIPKGVHVMRTLAGEPLYEGDTYVVEPGANLERHLRDGFLVEVTDGEANGEA